MSDGLVQNMAVYLALAINIDGLNEVLEMWIAKTKGGKFRLSVLTDLKNRGLQNIIIATADRLKASQVQSTPSITKPRFNAVSYI
jgi:putative transposase